MNDIFAKDLSGDLVSPEEPGYELLIDDIFSTMETAQELATVSVRDRKRVHELMEIILNYTPKVLCSTFGVQLILTQPLFLCFVKCSPNNVQCYYRMLNVIIRHLKTFISK